MGNMFTLPEVKFDWNKTITGKDRLVKLEEASTIVGPAYWVFSVMLCVAVAVIFGIRSTEVIGLVSDSATNLAFLFAVPLAASSLFFTPPKGFGLLARRLTVIGMVIASFKRDMDWDLGKELISSSSVEEGGRYALRGKVVVITGASSGVGLASAQLFSSYGATVVMGCRNQKRCEAAKRTVAVALSRKVSYVGPVVVGPALDLASLASVYSFAEHVRSTYPHIDILLNNAGSVADPGARTAQGYEELWGSMHLGHFALTEWLLPSLLKPLSVPSSAEEEDEDFMPLPHSEDALDQAAPADADVVDAEQKRQLRFMRGAGSSRVIWVASEAFLRGSFDESLLTGSGTADLHGEHVDNCGTYMLGLPCCPIGACPHTNGYARSKLANVLTAYELQKRVDAYALSLPASSRPRRLVSSSLHPGAVATNIHPVFSNPLSNWPMRSPLEAARLVVYAALEDLYIPGSYIDSMSRPHDLFGYFDSFLHEKGNRHSSAGAGDGIVAHTAAWPTAEKLPFYRAGVTEITRTPRTASNAAPPAGAMYEGSFLRWMMTGRRLTHRAADESTLLSMATEALQALVFGIAGTAIDTLVAAGNSKLFTPIHYLWGHVASFALEQGLWEHVAPHLGVHLSGVPSAQELANAAARRAQITLSARLWEVTDSLVLAFETAVKTGGDTAVLEGSSLGSLTQTQPQSHAGLRLRL